MSQQQMEHVSAQNEDDFMEGVLMATEDQETDEGGSNGSQEKREDTPPMYQPSDTPPVVTPPQPQPVQEPGPIIQQQEEAPQPPQPMVKTIDEIPEDLREEYEILKEQNPEAAALAMEDSKEGENMRRRLEAYGADMAEDYADRINMRRQQADDKAAMQHQLSQQAAQARVAHFNNVMKSEQPEFYEVLTKGSQAEQITFRNNILNWIKAKPYSEAEPLMRVFQYSQDPREVSDLLTQFNSERRRARTPDFAGAVAVPGRGGNVAPAGIGDEDDFAAGLQLSISSK